MSRERTRSLRFPDLAIFLSFSLWVHHAYLHIGSTSLFVHAFVTGPCSMSLLSSIVKWGSEDEDSATTLPTDATDEEIEAHDDEERHGAIAKVTSCYGETPVMTRLFRVSPGRMTCDGTMLSCVPLTNDGAWDWDSPCTALLDPAYDLSHPVELIFQVITKGAVTPSFASPIVFGLARHWADIADIDWLGGSDDSIGYRKASQERASWSDVSGEVRGDPAYAEEQPDLSEGDVVGLRVDPGTHTARVFVNLRLVSEFDWSKNKRELGWLFGPARCHLAISFHGPAAVKVLVQTGTQQTQCNSVHAELAHSQAPPAQVGVASAAVSSVSASRDIVENSVAKSCSECGAHVSTPFCGYCGSNLNINGRSAARDRSRSPRTVSPRPEKTQCGIAHLRGDPFPERRDFEEDELRTGAAKEDIEICRAISAQGDDISLEDALDRIRMTGKGAQLIVKSEPAEERLVECNRIRYSQDSCARRFRHGPYAGLLIVDAVRDLTAKRLHPERDDWLTLDVVSKENKLISMDNRRLWCLHEFQRRSGSLTVYAKIRVSVWNPSFDRFLEHLDSRYGSDSIRVRQ